MPKKNTKNQTAVLTPPTPRKATPFSLVGRTVVDVRPLEPDEMDVLGWDPDGDPGTVIQLTGGVLLWAVQDEESNGAGVLFCQDLEKQVEYGILADPQTKTVRYLKMGSAEGNDGSAEV